MIAPERAPVELLLSRVFAGGISSAEAFAYFARMTRGILVLRAPIEFAVTGEKGGR